MKQILLFSNEQSRCMALNTIVVNAEFSLQVQPLYFDLHDSKYNALCPTQCDQLILLSDDYNVEPIMEFITDNDEMIVVHHQLPSEADLLRIKEMRIKPTLFRRGMHTPGFLYTKIYTILEDDTPLKYERLLKLLNADPLLESKLNILHALLEDPNANWSNHTQELSAEQRAVINTLVNEARGSADNALQMLTILRNSFLDN